ncbi:hypothetical protein BUALT_Bualt17G0086900 [Buddleja alternifolia]|uniref:BHLH domain-containing protein n=1 Tax=Buddleja alternifolia TaxID=168488 RepID=A0AAV6W8U3_9LAMI|nr:hypothetical protein BUALT_Bualt17G0086900 [Buddleja alternifolia]
MDMDGKNTNIAPQKGRNEPVNYQAPNMSSNWQVNGNNLTNTSIGMIPIGNSMVESSTCSSAPMIDSFCPPIWDHSINGQSLGYTDMNVQNAMLRGNMFLPTVPGMIPQSLPHFPADSDFIERAARYSCFSGGNLVEVMNPFSVPDVLNPYSRVQGPHEVFGGNGSKPLPGMQSQRHEMNTNEVSKEGCFPGKHGTEGSPFKNEKNSENFGRSLDETKYGVDRSGNESEEAEFSGRGGQEELDGAAGESSGKGLDSKKRKRTGQCQDNEQDETNEAPQPSSETAKDMETKQKGDQNPTSVSKPSGKNGKQGSQGSDQPKEEYIHIRARRGQATNSHSLAERVRREKISERMKFLQDLVPGCSKVTGKAVMLDEIINYVQSLQRQVEFLSMKLATVNPRLDFNIEGLLAKDILQPRSGLSSSLVFPPDITIPFPQLHPSHPGLIQAGLPESLRRPINFQSNAPCGGFKESTSQVPSVWEDELHNVVHMGFNSTAPLNSQDLGGSLPPGHVKTEP